VFYFQYHPWWCHQAVTKHVGFVVKHLLRTFYKKCARVGPLYYNSRNYVLGMNNTKLQAKSYNIFVFASYKSHNKIKQKCFRLVPSLWVTSWILRLSELHWNWLCIFPILCCEKHVPSFNKFITGEGFKGNYKLKAIQYTFIVKCCFVSKQYLPGTIKKAHLPTAQTSTPTYLLFSYLNDVTVQPNNRIQFNLWVCMLRFKCKWLPSCAATAILRPR
jgi:hypothetical protein